MSDRLKEIRERIDRCYFTATSTAYSDIRYLLAQLAERDKEIKLLKIAEEATAKYLVAETERADKAECDKAERDALLERLCEVERNFNDDANLEGYFDVEIEHIADDYRKLKEGR